jgi:hypothetical protein
MESLVAEVLDEELLGVGALALLQLELLTKRIMAKTK